MTDFRDDFYKDYVEFKDWEAPSLIEPSEIFEIEFSRLKITRPVKILEIGFGKGELLDWARQKGHSVVGIEIIPRLVELAKSRGHQVFQLSALELEKSNFTSGSFDLIVIFDVLEHLYVPEIVDLLRNCNRLLSAEGKLLVRFPNGLSPFGLVQQMKDITHVTILGPDRMTQLGRLAGLTVESYDNSARPLSQGRRPRWMRLLLYRLRNLVERAVGFFYYGQRVPLDPNMSLILTKTHEQIGQ